MKVVLAPMEGLVDAVMRDAITRLGGVDWCVTEFVRVTSALLPARTWQRLAPELAQGARTRAGTPVHIQLLGSDPACLADNAARAAEYGAPAIDLNFGCPAKSVNRHRGGAALLDEPALLHDIVGAVRRAVPAALPVSAKMRLGFNDKTRALECAQALADGGANWLTVHARTKLEGYRPPAHWDWVARIREAVAVPVVANGEVWTLADYDAIRRVSGCDDVMIGRGLIARPDLAACIAARARGEAPAPLDWPSMLPWLLDFFRQCRALGGEGSTYPAARLKQWLGQLKRGFPEAAALFESLRPLRDAAALEAVLVAACRGSGRAMSALEPGEPGFPDDRCAADQQAECQ
ncbi:MAG: tRNA-dihydrouridine synthase family protein [Paludibacterium sp.]|uniref:tRNA dihydrouridine synthase n=1 Tax=Paludibacterium sp. TaxID=1917523 RepID=UPI0025FFFC63|nr:tRNA-dihydrouridine synthase family protein [Paludibacterium sp.]MBV8046325.1 tRNA-dihydrouridine synthase family protein [Paludibacterium sp.]